MRSGNSSQKAGSGSSEDQAKSAKGAPFWYLLGQRRVCGLALGFFGYNYTFYLLLTWLPSYFMEAHHVDLLHSGAYTSVPWLFATLTDLIVGGWLVDALIQRGWNPVRVRQAVLIGGTSLGLGILGAANAHTAAGALIWISISIGGLSAASPVGWSIPSLIAPKESVGTVGGILEFQQSACGHLPRLSSPVTSCKSRIPFAWAFVARRP